MANNRKYKTAPEELLARGRAIVAAGAEGRYLHKVEMVNLVLGGLTPSFLAQYCKDCKNAITGWVKAADERGFEALRDGKSTGRPPKLSAGQVAEIDALLQEEPSKHGYHVWDGPSVSDLIKKRYGIEYKVRSCQYLFKKLGYSRVRPQLFPSKGHEDSEAREALKKTPRIAVQCGRSGGFAGRGPLHAGVDRDVPACQAWQQAPGGILPGQGESFL